MTRKLLVPIVFGLLLVLALVPSDAYSHSMFNSAEKFSDDAKIRPQGAGGHGA